MVPVFAGAGARTHHTGAKADGALAGGFALLRAPARPPDPRQISVREGGRRRLSPSINSGDTRHFSAVIRARFPTLCLDPLRGCAHEMQTHSILGDVETKRGKKLPWGKWQWAGFPGKQLWSRWQEAGILACVFVPRRDLASVYFPRKVTGMQEARDTGHGVRHSEGMGGRCHSPIPGLLQGSFLFSSSLVSFTMSLPFSELNSGSQLLLLGAKINFNPKSHLQNELLGKLFPLANLIQTSPPFSVPEFSWLHSCITAHMKLSL